MSDRWEIAAAAGVGLGALMLIARAVTPSGAVVGALLCALFVGAGGAPAFTGFALLVVGGALLTAVGRSRKRALGQGGGARRDGWQAAANAGVAAACVAGLPTGGLVAGLGALSAAFADTASSELGLLARRPPRLLLVGPVTEPGRDGAMTLAGTLAGVAAAGVAGACAGAWDRGLGLPVLLAGVVGTVADSVLGCTLEPRLPGRDGNDVVNALATVAGASVAWAAGAD